MRLAVVENRRGFFGGAVLTASIYPDCVLTVTLVQLRQCTVASEFFSEMCLACIVKAIKVFVERGSRVIELRRSGSATVERLSTLVLSMYTRLKN